MGIESLTGNAGAKHFMKNELRIRKNSGTYLFYGRNGIDIDLYALSFAKGILCETDMGDFCGTCKNCIDVDKNRYTDLTIIEPENGIIGVDKIRELIYRAGSSAYSGSKKVFIIKEVSKMRAEAANAILKTIEEPPKNSFFILTTHTLNILQTIKSRAILVNIYPISAYESGLDEKIYHTLEGNTQGLSYIENMGAVEESYNSVLGVGTAFELYCREESLINRIKLYRAVEESINKIKFISKYQKIKIAAELEKGVSENREKLLELMQLFIIKAAKAGYTGNMEKLMELKEAIKYGVNGAAVLYLFFLSIE